MGMMELRRQVVLKTPHLETASGSTLSFTTDVPASLKRLTVSFDAVQGGSGTPSPTNIRPISGRDGVTVTVNGKDVTADFPGTLYGGYVDLVTGELVVTHGMMTFDGTRDWQAVAGSKFYLGGLDYVTLYGQTGTDHLSNLYLCGGTAAAGSSAVLTDKRFYWQTEYSAYMRIWVYDTGYTLAAFKAMLNQTPLQAMFRYTAPRRQTLTPQQLRTICGHNTIYSDAGDIEAAYWTTR